MFNDEKMVYIDSPGRLRGGREGVSCIKIEAKHSQGTVHACTDSAEDRIWSKCMTKSSRTTGKYLDI